MPVIEGFGDEVTNFMVVTIVILIGILSWWSTSIRDQPLIRTVLILEPHNRHQSMGTVLTAPISAAVNAEDTGQPETITLTEGNLNETGSEAVSNENDTVSIEIKLQTEREEPSTEPDHDSSPSNNVIPAHASTSSVSSSGEAEDYSNEEESSFVDIKDNPKDPDSGTNELRRRRLQFFQEKLEVPKMEADAPRVSQVKSSNDQACASSYTASVDNLPEGLNDSESSVVDSSTSKVGQDKISAPEACISQSPESPIDPLPTCSSESISSNQSCSQSGCSSGGQIKSSPDCLCSEKSPVASNSNKQSQELDDIRIRLKYLNDNQKMVQGKLQEPLGDFKRRHFGVELEGNKVVRLIFNGQVLHSDDQTLQNYGLFDNCVVHCLVHTLRATSTNADSVASVNNGEEVSSEHNGGEIPRDWDLSQLLYLSLSVILTMSWILRFTNPLLFSATSTIALFGLTGVYIITVVGMYMPDPEVVRT